MKKALLLVVLISGLVRFGVEAQNLTLPIGDSINSKAQCGTESLSAEEKTKLRRELKRANLINSNMLNDGTDCVPIKVHVIRLNDGSGGIPLADVAYGMANLNKTFKDANLEFYICGAINYINDSDWYDFDTAAPDSDNEATFCSPHDVSNAANLYIMNTILVNGGFSAAGYAYYPMNTISSTRIFMRNSAMLGAPNSTLSHELGHWFSLAHTHDLTESGNNVALGAERVVRTGANANCSTHGDELCDTEADPLYDGSLFDNGTCAYTGSEMDDLGVVYDPPINNIMSYYPDFCGGIFTPEQFTRMASGYTARTLHTAYDFSCAPTVVNVPTGVTAVLNGSVIDISWTDAATNELGYLLERSSTSSTSGFEAMLNGGVGPNTTSFTDDNLEANTSYWYRIKPINGDCNTYSTVTTEVVVGLLHCLPIYQNICTDPFNILISNFSISNSTPSFSNSSTCSTDNGSPPINYGDYKNQTINVSPGGTYNFTFGLSNIGFTAIFIDFNTDGDFDDTGERVFQNTVQGSGQSSGSFSIPGGASLGETVIRVRGANNVLINDACQNTFFGETEDYTLNIATTCSSASSIPTTAGLYTSTQSYTDGAMKYYCDGSGYMLLGVDASSAVPDDKVQLNIAATGALYYANGSGFINADPGAALLNQTWDVDATIGSDATVRFFMPSDALTTVNAALSGAGGVTVGGLTDFSFYKVTNGVKPPHEAITNLTAADVQIITNGSPASTSDWVGGTYGSKYYAEFKVSSFSGGGGGAGSGGGAILPVELVSFSGRTVNFTNNLTWQTASELNNDYFLIERSNNGREFYKVGQIKGSINSNRLINYSFIDQSPLDGINYYRLMQVDIDGQMSYSNIIHLTNNKVASFSLYPNPADQKVQLAFHTGQISSATLEIIDLQGRLLRHQQIETKVGNNAMEINTSDLPQGTYILRLVSNTDSHVVKFIISR